MLEQDCNSTVLLRPAQLLPVSSITRFGAASWQLQ
jgi:hypothetical protein